MNKLITALALLSVLSCSKTETGGNTPPVKPNATKEGDGKDTKGLLGKAKEAVGNIKENATSPLDDKSLTSLVGVANDLKAELGKAAATGEALDMKMLMAKAKDLKTVAEKHGIKVSELTGLVARVTSVMGAMKSGTIPESLKADVEAINKHKTELQALFQK